MVLPCLKTCSSWWHLALTPCPALMTWASLHHGKASHGWQTALVLCVLLLTANAVCAKDFSLEKASGCFQVFVCKQGTCRGHQPSSSVLQLNQWSCNVHRGDIYQKDLDLVSWWLCGELCPHSRVERGTLGPACAQQQSLISLGTGQAARGSPLGRKEERWTPALCTYTLLSIPYFKSSLER